MPSITPMHASQMFRQMSRHFYRVVHWIKTLFALFYVSVIVYLISNVRILNVINENALLKNIRFFLMNFVFSRIELTFFYNSKRYVRRSSYQTNGYVSGVLISSMCFSSWFFMKFNLPFRFDWVLLVLYLQAQPPWFCGENRKRIHIK